MPRLTIQREPLPRAFRPRRWSGLGEFRREMVTPHESMDEANRHAHRLNPFVECAPANQAGRTPCTEGHALCWVAIGERWVCGVCQQTFRHQAVARRCHFADRLPTLDWFVRATTEHYDEDASEV
jgi:hypothetical protein